MSILRCKNRAFSTAAPLFIPTRHHELTEVLQGFSKDKQFNRAKRLLTALVVVNLGGRSVANQAARHFRALSALGVTVRKTVHTVIATRCIMDGYTLLHSDRDFDPFVAHLGLRSVARRSQA